MSKLQVIFLTAAALFLAWVWYILLSDMFYAAPGASIKVATPTSKTAVPAKASPTSSPKVPAGAKILKDGKNPLVLTGDLKQDIKEAYIWANLDEPPEKWLALRIQYPDSDLFLSPTGGVLKEGLNSFDGLGIKFDVYCEDDRCYYTKLEYKRVVIIPDPKCAEGSQGQFPTSLIPGYEVDPSQTRLLVKRSYVVIQLFRLEKGEVAELLAEVPWPTEGQEWRYEDATGTVLVRNCNGALMWAFIVKRSS